MLRFLVYIVAMCILSALINHLDKRGIKSLDKEGTNYVVRIPAMLKYVYFSLFAMGVLLFFVFLFFKSKGNPSITNGNFITALIICAIGLTVMAFASKWHIVVNDDKFTIYRLFGKKEINFFSDLDNAVEGHKGQIEVYKKGKKIVTVDLLCENYDSFCNSLSKYGKLQHD